MGETAASNPALQLSVSFGRFESDSLCWEKWSCFSPNKYLEEVEKFATPGSVAQKKAYFEAHYRSIAARKAELLAQEKQQNDKDSLGSECQNGEDLSCSTCRTDAGFDISNTSVEKVNPETSSISEIVRIHANNLEEDVAASRDYQSSLVEGENEELESRSHSSQIGRPEEVVCVEQEESPNIQVENLKEVSHEVDNETVKASEIEVKDVTLDQPKVSKKVSPVNKDIKASNVKKKPVLPTTKAPQISTPKSSRPASTPTKTSSTKRGSSLSLSGRKVTPTAENRKVPTKSLHMSITLAPSKPDPAVNTTMRKSLIMETMGDKDIVKQAFKTFQNSFNQPKTSAEAKSVVKEQVLTRGTESRFPTSIALRKENGQSAKVDSMEKRSRKIAVGSTTLGLKTDNRTEQGKESSRKLEEKFNAKEIERTRLQSKLKEEKLKHNRNATPLETFYQGKKVSKGHPEKGDVKIEKWR